MIKVGMKTISSIIIWLYWALCIIFFFFVVALLYIVTFPFDTYKRIPNLAVKGLALSMMKANPWWSFQLKGADPAKLEKPTIVVANHQSFLDMPLSYMLPWTMKWVAKKDLFRIPIFGWIISMTGHLAIDRKSSRSVRKLDKLVEPIQHGIPAMIFPEGTRSRDGNLLRFKNGAFKLAKRYNFNILPIVLEGGYHAMPTGTWRVAAKQNFKLSVLDPINADEFDSVEELKNTVHSLIDEELAKLRTGESIIREE